MGAPNIGLRLEEGIFGCLAIGGYEGGLLYPEPRFLVFQIISLTSCSSHKAPSARVFCALASGTITAVHTISQIPIKRHHAPHHRESHHTKPVFHPVTLLPSTAPHFPNHLISFSVPFHPIHTYAPLPLTNWKETKRTTNPTWESHLKGMREWNHTVKRRKKGKEKRLMQSKVG